MKYLLYILVILLSTHTSQAQKIHFTDTSNIWTVKHTTMSNQFRGGYNYKMSYDTTRVMIDTLEYLLLKGKGSFLVREDTIEKRVYIKINPASSNLDTTEQVLYDYTLNVGDTVTKRYYLKDTSMHIVTKIDSVSVNGVYHKLWRMDPVPGSYMYRYEVIEGIGCMNGPTYPLDAVGWEQAYSLICFSNNGSILTVPANKNIYIPMYNGNVLSPEKCLLSVDETSLSDNNVMITPNPAHNTATVYFPYKISKGEVVISNIYGQILLQQQVSNTQTLSIDIEKLTTGLYHYRVIDNMNQTSWAGKIIKE